MFPYALNILKGRFEKGEIAISKNTHYSYRYALKVLHGRFEKGENAISKDADYSKFYRENIYDAEKELEKELEKKQEKKEQKELEDLRNSISINNLYRLEI